MAKRKKKIQKNLAPKKIGVKNIATKELRANPHNPRMLFDKEPMKTLENSIRKVGILVPLVVYKGKKHTRHTILDGQRRWICAQNIGLNKVPVNVVAEPSVVANIVTMFQIHKLREDWELMPTALKLEVLMNKLDEHSEVRLAELVGLDKAVIIRCKKLLSYSAKYQEMMLDPDPKGRMKSDFFIELYTVRNDRFVNQMTWFRKDAFTNRMIRKYKNPDSDLKAVTDFRKMKQYITRARKAGKDDVITRRLQKYSIDDTLTMEYLVIRKAETIAEKRKIIVKINALQTVLEKLDVDEYYGEGDLWEALEKLIVLVRKRLRDADRRVQR